MNFTDGIRFADEALAISMVCFVVDRSIRIGVDRGDGYAGAATRILATLLAPALVLGFARLFYWPLSLLISTIISTATGQGRRLAPVARGSSALNILFTGAVLVLVGTKGALSVASTPYELDSNNYHVPMSASFLQIHATSPAQIMFFPANAELLDALGIGALGAVGGQTLTEMLVILALWLAAYSLAQTLGANDSIALAAAASVTAIPMVADQAMTAQNDIFVAATLLAGIALWKTRPTLAAIAFGLAAGTKFTGFVECALIIVTLWSIRSPQLRLRDALIGLGFSVPWYLQTAIQTHNPVFLGNISGGYTSTIWAHIAQVWPLMVSSLRNYGGLVAVLGVFAVVFIARDDRDRLFRRLPILVVGLFVLWVTTPNTAESVPGTLDQIRAGWSIRYILLAPVLLDIVAIVAFARWKPAAGIAIAGVSVLFTLMREFGAVMRVDSGAAIFCAPLVVALAFLLFACTIQRSRAGLATTFGVVLLAITNVAGGSRIERIWQTTYEHEGEMGAGMSLAVAPLTGATRIAVIEVPPLPVIGPRLRRYVVSDQNGTTLQTWWNSIVAERPEAIIARNLRERRGTPGEHELFLRSTGKYRLSYEDAQVRVYVPRS